MDGSAEGGRRAVPETWASKDGADISSCPAEVPSIHRPLSHLDIAVASSLGITQAVGSVSTAITRTSIILATW